MVTAGSKLNKNERSSKGRKQEQGCDLHKKDHQACSKTVFILGYLNRSKLSFHEIRHGELIQKL